MRKGIAYLRVSTAEQGASGLGLEAQEAAVRSLAAQHGIELVEPPAREVQSGRDVRRPVLLAALERARREGLVLLVAKLDRLGRRASYLHALRDAGVMILAGDLPPLEGPAATLLFGVMAAQAQAEAEATSARTKAALSAARARGVRLGGHRPGACAKGTAALQRRARERADALRFYVESLDREAGVTLGAPALAQALEARGARTPRGGTRWSYAQAMRLRALLAKAW